VVNCVKESAYRLDNTNNYVRLRNTRTKAYAGRVACCPLVDHVEYAPRALLRLEKRWDGWTDRGKDGRTPDRYITITARRSQRNFGGSNHITGTAEPKVVKFSTQVGYINSNNSMTYHQQKLRGYVKFLPFVVMQRVARLSYLY